MRRRAALRLKGALTDVRKNSRNEAAGNIWHAVYYKKEDTSA